jgi:hypothetical protein
MNKDNVNINTIGTAATGVVAGAVVGTCAGFVVSHVASTPLTASMVVGGVVGGTAGCVAAVSLRHRIEDTQDETVEIAATMIERRLRQEPTPATLDKIASALLEKAELLKAATPAPAPASTPLPPSAPLQCPLQQSELIQEPAVAAAAVTATTTTPTKKAKANNGKPSA